MKTSIPNPSSLAQLGDRGQAKNLAAPNPGFAKRPKGSGPRIAIIHHGKQPRETEDFFYVSWMARRWAEWGYEVKHLYGPDDYQPADLAVLHVDLSIVPDDYLAMGRRYPRTVNLGLTDIRKRTVSDNLVRRGDGYTGPVIIKTDLNHGGTPEALLGGKKRPPPPGRLQVWARRLGIKDPMRMRTPEDYVVYPYRILVPRKVYQNRRLVVEKFLPERHGPYYYHRRYYFFGDAERNEIWRSRVRINAADESCDEFWTDPVPEAIRVLRKRFKADYGKMDYVLRNGRVELFDINRTPSGTVLEDDPEDAAWAVELTDILALGITTWLPRPEPSEPSSPGTNEASPGVGGEGESR